MGILSIFWSDLWSVLHNEPPGILQPQLFQGLQFILQAQADVWEKNAKFNRFIFIFDPSLFYGDDQLSIWQPVQRGSPLSSPSPSPEEWQSQCWPLRHPAQDIWRATFFGGFCKDGTGCPSTWKRKVWSWSLVLVAFTAASTPATATLAVPWMSSLNVQNLHNKVKYILRWQIRSCKGWIKSFAAF